VARRGAPAPRQPGRNKMASDTMRRVLGYKRATMVRKQSKQYQERIVRLLLQNPKRRKSNG